MDFAINDLFSVILLSEKVALDEKKRYREVKDKIESLHIRLKKQIEARKECMEKLERLTDGLFHSIFGTKLIKSKEEFLTKEMKLLEDEIKLDTKRMESLNASYEESSKAFMTLVCKFSSEYGISSNRRETRDFETKSAIKTLHTLVETLTNELQELQRRDNEFSKMMNRLKERNQQKNVLEYQRKEFEKQLEKEMLKIEELQEEHLQLEVISETDTTFTTLNSELQKHQTSNLEMEVRDLQKNLNQLSRMVKEKEGQRFKQQFKEWQRQRQQMIREKT